MTDTYSLSFTGDKANQGLGTINNFDDSYQEHNTTITDQYIVERVTPVGIIPIDITAPVNGLRISFKIQTPGTGALATLKIFGLSWGPLAVETKTGSNPPATDLQAGVQVDFILNTNVVPNKWILAQTTRQTLSRGYNIKDYGAVGDYDPDTNIGTDDTTAINDTVAAIYSQAADGALMDIPVGYYLTQGGHDMVTGTTMIGEGASASFYSKDNLPNSYVFKTKDTASGEGDSIVFEDFYVDGRRNSLTISNQMGILVSGSYHTVISDVTLKEMSDYSIMVTGINRGGGNTSLTDLTSIENVTITSSDKGIYVASNTWGETDDTSITNTYISAILNSSKDGMALRNEGCRTRSYNLQARLCDGGIYDDTSRQATHFGLISNRHDTFGIKIEKSEDSKVIGGVFGNNGQRFIGDTATLDGTANTITLTTKDVTGGDRFRITSTGSLPTGLAENIYYYADATAAAGIPFQFYDVSDSFIPVDFGTDGSGDFSFIATESAASGAEITGTTERAIISNCTFYNDQYTNTQQFGVFVGDTTANNIIFGNTCKNMTEYSYFISKTVTGNLFLFNQSETPALGDYYFDADASYNAAAYNVVIGHHLNIIDILNGYIQFYEIIDNVPVAAGAKVHKFSTDGTFESDSDEEVATLKATKTYVDNTFVAKTGDIMSGILLFSDDIIANFGTDSDYSMGYNSADDSFRIGDGADLISTPRFMLDSSGNVGIGTIEPTTKLDINGNIILTGSDRYLNYNIIVGSSGYGFRDNAGVIEFKDSGGTWASFGGAGAGVWTKAGTNLSPTTPGDNVLLKDGEILKLGTDSDYSIGYFPGDDTLIISDGSDLSVPIIIVNSTGEVELPGELDVVGEVTLNNKLVINNISSLAPLNIVKRDTVPSAPILEDIYLDDGTNTESGNLGLRRYNGAAFEDINSNAWIRKLTTAQIEALTPTDVEKVYDTDINVFKAYNPNNPNLLTERWEQFGVNTEGIVKVNGYYDDGGLCTFNGATDTVAALTPPLDDEKVTFKSIGPPLPVEIIEDTTYYVINATGATFQISETLGGSVFPFSDNAGGVAPYFNLSGTPVKPSYTLVADTPQFIEYPANTKLQISSSTDWPSNNVKTDNTFYNRTPTPNKFLENNVNFQETSFRVRCSFTKATDNYTQIATLILNNPITGFTIERRETIKRQETAGNLNFLIKTIADSGSIGNGYTLSLECTYASVFTVTDITRFSAHKSRIHP